MNSLYGIFAVDDDQMIATHLKHQITEYLSHDEIIVETFIDPKEAIKGIKEIVEEGVIPLICFVDFQMPGIRGDQFIRKIKEQFRGLKCILLTGNSSALIVADLAEEGYLEFYLEKPWDVNDLYDVIDKCLPINLKRND